MKIEKRKILFLFFLVVLEFNILAQQYILNRNDVDEKYIDYSYAFNEATKCYLFGNYKSAMDLYRECLKAKPNSGTVHYQLAKIFLNTRNLKLAKQSAIDACKCDENNKWFLMLLETIYENENNLDSALIITKQIYKNDPKNIDNLYKIAELIERLGYKMQTLSYLDSIENRIGKTREICLKRYTIYDDLGKPEKAFDQLSYAYNLDTDNHEVIGLLAEFYRRESKQDSAMKFYRMIYPKYSDDANVAFSYAEYLLELDSIKQSSHVIISTFKNLSIDEQVKKDYLFRVLQNSSLLNYLKPYLDTISTIYYNLYYDDINCAYVFSNIQMALKNYQKSLSSLKRIVNSNVDNYQVWEEILYAYNFMDNFDSLDYYAQITIEKYNNQPLPYLFLGNAKIQKKEYNQALLALEKGLTMTKDKKLQIDFYSLMAESYLYEKNYIKSNGAYENALKIDPTNISIKNNYAYYLSERNESLNYAKSMSYSTIKEEPKNATYLDTYAWILYKMNRKKAAARFMDKALKNGGSNDADIVFHYIRILVNLKKYDEAITILEKCKSFFGSNYQVKVQDTINEIKKLKK